MTTAVSVLDGTPLPAVRTVSQTFMRLDAAELASTLQPENQLYLDSALGVLRLGGAEAKAILPTEPYGTFGGITRPTGLAQAPDGSLVVAEPNEDRLLRYTTYAGTFRPLWPARLHEPPDAYTLKGPRGVAFSPTGDLVVADTGHDRVILYTWPHVAVRRVIGLPAGAQPWDLQYDEDGRLYVAAAGLGRVLRFSRLLNQDTEYSGGAGSLKAPRHMAFDSEGVLFTVDTAVRAVIALDEAGSPLSVAPDVFSRRFPPPLTIEEDGLSLAQDARPDCERLDLPSIEIDGRGRLKGTQVGLVALPHGVRYPRYGSLVTQALDSGIFDCQWHRLVFDVSVVPGTTLRVSTLTAPADIDPGRLAEVPEARWATPLLIGEHDLPEVLVQSPPGRNMWLRIELMGDGDATPQLRSVTVYAPRHSSMSYLPHPFHEEPVSANFLDRYLSYFDTVFSEIETRIEGFAGYLDPYGVPREFLPWLGSWFDIEFLAQWPEATQRRFVRQAIVLFRQRGTIAGLQEMIRLHTGVREPFPVMLEHFRLRTLTEPLHLGGHEFQFDPAREIAHNFTVIMPAAVVADVVTEQRLRAFIDEQKPAHTRYQLLLVRPGIRIGCQSAIGIDTIIGTQASQPIGEVVLDLDSLIAAETETRPRLGSFRILSGSKGVLP
jgi:phage tail-like protein